MKSKRGTLKSQKERASDSHKTDRKSRKKKASNKFQKVNCSPTTSDDELDYTCYSKCGLKKLAELWNSRHPDDKIESENTKEIWKSLKERLRTTCNKESCWLRQSFVKTESGIDKKLLAYSFSPQQPSSWKKSPNTWLTSTDISKVMRQYERAYKCFDFIGPSPIDFDTYYDEDECVWQELCDFSLKSHLAKGKNKIGIVFNTDPHYKDGSHWISLFINVKRGYIFFFDSVGTLEPNEVTVFMNKVQSQGKELGIKLRIVRNTLQHQVADSECGMYSLFSIIGQLTDKFPMELQLTHKIRDSEMFKLRSKYFNKEL